MANDRTPCIFNRLELASPLHHRFDDGAGRLAKMVLKIDRSRDGKYVVLLLSGRMQSEHVEQLRAEMEDVDGVVLDLEDVKLVDREAVHFLSECEASGTELRHCSPYIREWIAKEKNTPEPNTPEPK